ncbi:hypothetical protein N7541_000004 [Penicillium brevicompactum]|uniref:Uncharacterized protein n=1 Tax=Penicillium brevicompactum TaxID=5074 RepID=A0A9W9RTA1_PENBR|nr:hypothetical protein N7541_000004 [Penicillium brevicompactum]
MANSLCSDDAYQTRTGNPWDDSSQYAPTPGYFGRTPTIFSPSPAPDCATDQVQSDKLDFLPLAEWDEDAEYDEQLPTHMRYTIAWKVMFNRKKVGSVTEKDLVVSPADYWVKTLKRAVEELLRMKRKVASEFDLKARLLLSKWTPVEKQLRKWSNLIRVGKILTIEIVFNYRGGDDGPSMSVSRTAEKRGRVSATSRMLAERERAIHNEEENTGRPATWDLVYGFMRCDVRSCPLKSDWCWEDPKDKKHYKMRAPHLERLIDYVDGGGSLDSHDDVPSDICRDLVLESQTGRKSKKTDIQPSLMLPPDDYVVIPGSRQAAVRQYCKWLESRATDEAYKADFRKICQATLENHLDLELILEDPDSGFFVQRGSRLEQLVASCATSKNGLLL